MGRSYSLPLRYHGSTDAALRLRALAAQLSDCTGPLDGEAAHILALAIIKSDQLQRRVDVLLGRVDKHRGRRRRAMERRASA